MKHPAGPAPDLGKHRPERAWSQLFHLDPNSGISLQAQIRRIMVAAILDKRLAAGAPLPSSRVLAQQLDVARNTVNAAYRQLTDDGFVVAQPRSGYHVAHLPAGTASPKAISGHAAETPDGPRWAARIGSRYSTMRNITKPADWHRYPYQFIYGQPDPALFPISDWRACSRAALAVLAIRDWTADMIDGDDMALVEQLQRRVLPRRGIFATADQIMITVGTQHALYMLAELLVSPSSVVGVEEPGYPDARNIFSLRGAALRPLPVGDDGITDDALSGCDLAYLTPSHQCPTSATMNLTRRQEVLTHAERHDLLIIEDDYDSEMSFAETPLPAMKSLDRTGRVIYLGSLSKTLAPGLRLGFMVGAPELIAEARVLRRLMLRHPPANNQRAAALFISLGHHDALLGRVRKSLTERAEALSAALRAHAPSLRFAPLLGGSSVWVRGPEGLDTTLLARNAERAGILIEPGELFFHQPRTPCPYFRLGFASTPADRISEGVKRLAALLDEARV